MRLFLVLAFACAEPVADTAATACERDPPFTYDNFGRGFMGQHCAGCHSSLISPAQRKGAPAGVDLDTYEGVLHWADRVKERATGDVPTMPPGGGPTALEIERLGEWLDCAVLPEAGR